MTGAAITFWGHGSPNPHKVAIALEELGLPYEARIVDTAAGEQHEPWFAAMSPNAKVPVIQDAETGRTLYESNAILLYLADKAARLVPPAETAETAERDEALQLLFLQASAVGPMFGQRAWFSLFAPDKPAYALERYRAEGHRLETVLDRLLDGRDHFLASGYSIVDIAFFGWVWCATHQGFAIDDHPRLSRWYDRVAARPAVRKGVTVPLPLPDFAPYRAAPAL